MNLLNSRSINADLILMKLNKKSRRVEKMIHLVQPKIALFSRKVKLFRYV